MKSAISNAGEKHTAAELADAMERAAAGVDFVELSGQPLADAIRFLRSAGAKRHAIDALLLECAGFIKVFGGGSAEADEIQNKIGEFLAAAEDAPQAWADDVALLGPNTPRSDGQIKHLIEYLLTVYKRFGNTAITFNLKWGASALWKRDEQAKLLAFTPTHTHADGGTYQLIGKGKVRVAMSDGWSPAVFYKGEDGAMFATGEDRWAKRFKPLLGIRCMRCADLGYVLQVSPEGQKRVPCDCPAAQ